MFNVFVSEKARDGRKGFVCLFRVDLLKIEEIRKEYPKEIFDVHSENTYTTDIRIIRNKGLLY